MKQLLMVSTLFFLYTHTVKTVELQLSRNAKLTGAAIVASGTAYLLSKGYSAYLLSSAQTRFKTERALLNQYAAYSHLWNADLDQQLKRYLKAEIIKLHNKNRDKWTITILYESWAGKPAYLIDKHYAQFPLLQHKKDIAWYLKRLKIVRFFSLHSDLKELTLLIDQLTYIRDIIISDHDYNTEEQAFIQRG